MAKTHEWTCPNCNTKAVFSLSEPPPFKKSVGAIGPVGPVVAWKEFTRRNPVLTFGILGASLISIASGVYLYLEGQTLWAKAKQQLRTPAPVAKEAAVAATEVQNQSSLPAQDAVKRVATAPERPASPLQALVPSQAQLRVKARTGYANFRSGPGMDYPVVGITRGNQSYPVIDWKERWLKVIIKAASASTPADTAWVRSDMTAPTSD